MDRTMTTESDCNRYAYRAGIAAGVADAHAGILEPENGYPEDELYRRGVERGRVLYREAVESLLVPTEMPISIAQPRRVQW